MKRVLRKLSLMLAMATLITTMTVPAFASGDTEFKVENIVDATTVLFVKCDDIWVSDLIETKDTPTITRDGVTITALKDRDGQDECDDCGKYHFLAAGVKEKEFIRKAKDAANNSRVKDLLNDMTGLGVAADTNKAMNTLTGLIPVLNWLLGIIVVLITVGLTIVTSFDVAYIVFPVFRDRCEESKATGQGPGVKKTANGGTKLRLVSDEAQYAVKECSIESGKSPLSAYLTKRLWAYILVSVILFILLTGNINVITNIAITIVGYLMQVLSTLG